jgi:Zn-dependent membrane protease YugP
MFLTQSTGIYQFDIGYTLAYFLVLITMLFSIGASIGVKSTFRRYSSVYSTKGVPASVIARQILDSNGLYNVEVVRINGNLTDHYDPKRNVVALSDSVYNSHSVAAIGVAAHEVGHAVQHARSYLPIKIRTAIFPVVQLCSSLWIWLFILGLALNYLQLTTVGIIFFAFVVVFQLVTLPVEFNASRRALNTIQQQYILEPYEMEGAKKTLRAAAMTYVAALAVSIAQLLRLIATANRRRR